MAAELTETRAELAEARAVMAVTRAEMAALRRLVAERMTPPGEPIEAFARG